MNKSWKIAVAFLVVFAAGGVIGWVSTLRFVKPPPVVRPATPPEDFGPQLVRRWVNSNQLSLSPAQRAQIMPVVGDAAEDLRRLRREDTHSGVLILEHMQDQIALVLTPAQRNKFNEMTERRRDELNKFILQQQRQALKQQQIEAR